MIEEIKLTKYYSAIAEKLDEIIPVKWDKISMYAEEVGDVNSVSVYYYTNNGMELHHSGDIPNECNIDEDIYDSLTDELIDINKKLWLEFKNAEEPTWCSLTFNLDCHWKFQVKFAYERDNEIGRLEREIRWAYNELGAIPKDEYEKELLEEYLEERRKSI
ncbi:immunity protein YezG family protein [Paraclostridium ghonii]|uniref:immunity protein YezG family protein n=1 Tax=Paraclostridium ghonii TaxID=29358 RepID=UPI00202CADF5|nr:immunity protein YezG family protein [Paeniclostridium ghonii]MCM0167945.1 antitoxin YezG family protein [Paeniclostridium ghonii]